MEPQTMRQHSQRSLTGRMSAFSSKLNAEYDKGDETLRNHWNDTYTFEHSNINRRKRGIWRFVQRIVVLGHLRRDTTSSIQPTQETMSRVSIEWTWSFVHFNEHMTVVDWAEFARLGETKGTSLSMQTTSGIPGGQPAFHVQSLEIRTAFSIVQCEKFVFPNRLLANGDVKLAMIHSSFSKLSLKLTLETLPRHTSVWLMTIPGLHLGLQVDIFALFNRPELSRISETNRRVNAIIEKHFASSPRLVFDYVFYKSIGWKWSDDADLNQFIGMLGDTASPMSDSQIAQMPTSKFLRFRRSDFYFDKEYPLDLLEAHKHLWIGGRLTVFAPDFWRSTELPQFASLVNTSHDLHMYVPGALDMLSNLFLGSVKHIEISDACFPHDSSNANRLVDSIFNYTKQLPVVEITNFLFNNACRKDQCRRMHLNISTKYTPKYCEKVVDSIKQKFLNTTDPSEFYFHMSGPTGFPLASNWILDHTDSEKKLHYYCHIFSGYMYLNLDCYEYSVSTSNSTSNSTSTSTEYSDSE
ncbi:hypothetical protein Ddc_16693 [Ditylenchus destructor]|nr:hypothetical protein Ddc_16693 [Ditylenchus destructor]